MRLMLPEFSQNKIFDLTPDVKVIEDDRKVAYDLIGPRGPSRLSAVVSAGSEVPSLPCLSNYPKLLQPFLQGST